jgi:adenylate cyclase
MSADRTPPPRCFQGVAPATIATCSKDGEPNVTYISQVYWIDDKHVALSRQFLNKTSRNIDENPQACVQLLDPLTQEAYELDVVFQRSETSGPLFDEMFLRIEAIASQFGMSGVFKLIAADIYEVVSTRFLEGFRVPIVGEPPLPFPPGPPERRSELRALQVVSDGLNRAVDLERLLASFLAALRDELGFEHSMLLMPDDRGDKLFTVASSGFGESGVGAEIAVGQGLIGTVARQRKLLRFAKLDVDMRYQRAIRGEVTTQAPGEHVLTPEIPLPGLSDAQSHLAIPLLVQDRLVGVLAVESRNPLGFDEWHEAFLTIIGNQAAMAIERMVEREDDVDVPPPARPSVTDTRRSHAFRFYKGEDCVFVDGEYLIRNVPARILWKILRSWLDEGRTEFTNRELRLDPWLELPPVKDNLESRLILLRKRLEQKCPDLRLPSCSRGHFRLEMDCRLELEERAS